MSQCFSSICFLTITLNRKSESPTKHQSPAKPKGVIMTAHGATSDEIPSNHPRLRFNTGMFIWHDSCMHSSRCRTIREGHDCSPVPACVSAHIWGVLVGTHVPILMPACASTHAKLALGYSVLAHLHKCEYMYTHTSLPPHVCTQFHIHISSARYIYAILLTRRCHVRL